MKKFQFRLERVLRYHQQKLKQAELRTALAAAERNTAQAAVVRCQQQIDQACELNESAGSLINPASRTNLTAHVEQLGAILKSARERLKNADLRFRETEKVRAEISQEVEGFSRLRDLRRQEHRDEISRQQQIDLDEVVMRRWSAGNSDDEYLAAGISE